MPQHVLLKTLSPFGGRGVEHARVEDTLSRSYFHSHASTSRLARPKAAPQKSNPADHPCLNGSDLQKAAALHRRQGSPPGAGHPDRRHPNLRAFVVDTGSTPAPGLAGILLRVNALSGRDWVEMSRRTRAQDVRSQYPGLDGVEDYGYALTDLVMEDIMRAGAGDREGGPESGGPGDDPHAPLCDTLTVTNGDNVYGPDFLRQTLGPIADLGMDMVGTNWISHHDFGQCWRSGTPAYASEWCGPHRSGGTQEMKASPVFECNCIDLGAVVFKVRQVRQSGIRFVLDKVRANQTLGDLRFADCHFFKRLKASGANSTIVHAGMVGYPW